MDWISVEDALPGIKQCSILVFFDDGSWEPYSSNTNLSGKFKDGYGSIKHATHWKYVHMPNDKNCKHVKIEKS